MTDPHAALPLALLLGVAALVALRGAAVARRTGRSVLTFGDGDVAHDFLGRVFRGVAALLTATFVVRLALPGFDPLTGPIDWLATPLVAWTGIGLLGLGAAIVATAQWRMGSSWRIGLAQETTALVTGGWFRISRNPVFLGFLIVLAGAGLTAPSALTAVAFAAGWLAMSVQARLEEADLEQRHGLAYARYRARVRRWL